MDKIGFIGLGIMGEPMAKNLIKAGYHVNVLASSNAASNLTEAGAQAHPDLASLTTASDVIITMLPDSPEVKQIVLASGGVIDSIRPGSLFIDMSTISPATAIKLHDDLAAKNVEALDAPVSGGQVGAQNAALSIMVGGSNDAFQRAHPIFSAMGKNIIHIGPAGAGQTTKTCNQIIVGMTIQAVAEAFTLAQKAGVDLAKMREALLGGFAQSRILDLHGQRIIDRNFQPGFKVKLHRKDLNIALEAGLQHKVPLQGTAHVAQNMDQLITNNNGELDHSALALLLERMSGLH